MLHCVKRTRGGTGPPFGGSREAPQRKKKLPQEMYRIFALFFVSPRFSCPLLGDFSAHGFLPSFLFSVK
jgi:hypothetical protein